MEKTEDTDGRLTLPEKRVSRCQRTANRHDAEWIRLLWQGTISGQHPG